MDFFCFIKHKKSYKTKKKFMQIELLDSKIIILV
jgi:hypothetical protein